MCAASNPPSQSPAPTPLWKRRYALYIAVLAATPVLYWWLHRPEPVPEYLHARAEHLAWFRDAKFGVMITWGPASLTGKEISWSRAATRPGEEGTGIGDVPLDTYDRLYESFNPTQFNATAWIELFRQAGAKYIVLVTKHHDGFCMFDSRLTEYKITRSPFGRDVTAEIAAACHKAGLKLGLYYSPPDWRQPDYRTKTHDRYIPYLHGHLHELCLGYGQVDMFWFDGLYWRVQDWDSEGLFRMIRRLQPQALINNRAALEGDFDVRENDIGDVELKRPWETCMPIGTQWSYKLNDAIKPLSQCLSSLLRVAGSGGTFLLNVGPRAEGLIDPAQAERLRQIGEWLSRCGESVYATEPGPFRPDAWGASTHRDRFLYVHVLDAQTRQLTLPGIDPRIRSVSLLTGGQVTFSQTDERIQFSIEPPAASEPPWTLRLELNGPSPGMMPDK